MLHSSHLWTGPTKQSVQQSKKPDDNDTISPVRLSLGLIYDKLATKRKHFQTKNYNDLVQSLSKPKFELPKLERSTREIKPVSKPYLTTRIQEDQSDSFGRYIQLYTTDICNTKLNQAQIIFF